MSASAQENLGLPHAMAYRIRNLWAHSTHLSGDRIGVAVKPPGVMTY